MSTEPEYEKESVRDYERAEQSAHVRDAHESVVESTEEKQKRFSLWFPAMALVLAAAVYLYSAVGTGPISITDSVSASKAEQVTATFNQAINQGAEFGRLLNIGDRQTQNTIREVYGQADAEKIISDAKAGVTDIVLITVHDWLEEDGDVLRLVNPQLDVTVPIWNKPSEIPIPITQSSAYVDIYAVTDGGGGVTAAAEVNGSPVSLPPFIDVSTSVRVPLTSGLR